MSFRTRAYLAQGRGFTLVELLVVIGIVAVLSTILLPAIGKVREEARRTFCLSHVRELTQAALAYAADNDQVLPEAAATNSFQSPLSPRSAGAPAWSAPPFTPNAYVLPSIGALLLKYLGSDVNAWRCPGTWDDPTGATVFAILGDNPYSGWQPTDEFLPNYNYESAKEYLAIAAPTDPSFDSHRLRAWAVRSVSGLRINRAAPIAGTNQSVVLFHDRDSTYHSAGHVDIYTTRGDWNYYANYGYLDGHAEGQTYHNVDQYLAVMHGPIPQQWFGRDFRATFPEQYATP